MNSTVDKQLVNDLKSLISECEAHDQPKCQLLLAFLNATVEASGKANQAYEGKVHGKAISQCKISPSPSDPSAEGSSQEEHENMIMVVDSADSAPNGIVPLDRLLGHAECQDEGDSLSWSGEWVNSSSIHTDADTDAEADSEATADGLDSPPQIILSSGDIPTEKSCQGCSAHLPESRLSRTVAWTSDVLDLCRTCQVSNSYLKLLSGRGRACDVLKVLSEGFTPGELAERVRYYATKASLAIDAPSIQDFQTMLKEAVESSLDVLRGDSRYSEY